MRKTRLTEAKKQRAIDAIVALMECDDFPNRGTTTWELENACTFIRKLEASSR